MKSPTGRLVAGLVLTLAVIGAYAAFTLRSVNRMREMQTDIVDRNRLGSLQLIRIQNDLHSLGLAMRDMLDNPRGYPIVAWRAPLNRIRQNLDDALRREAELAQGRRSPQQTSFLRSGFDDFWRACDAMFAIAEAQGEPRAHETVRATLQPRQEALTAMTARLLVENNDAESRAASEIEAIFSQIERNAYILLGASLLLISLTSASLIRATRAMFSQITLLADQRRELARQLISTQESTLRTVSRDLHDEFGQILTALGAMLRRADRLAPQTEFRAQIHEAGEIVQHTLENIRSLSQALQPVILEEQGLLAAVKWHVEVFERQTGIRVSYRGPSIDASVPPEEAIHVFRIVQEALNNVARHANVSEVKVSLGIDKGELEVVVEDEGRGIPDPIKPGIGLAAMRERAELIGGRLTIGRGSAGGTRVHLQMPAGVTKGVAVV